MPGLNGFSPDLPADPLVANCASFSQLSRALHQFQLPSWRPGQMHRPRVRTPRVLRLSSRCTA